MIVIYFMTMSWVEQIVNQPIYVSNQYDTDVSNQCSWCAYRLAVASPKLSVLALNNSCAEFKEVYDQCIQQGTEDRVKYYKYKCGENVDDPELIALHPSLSIQGWYQTIVSDGEMPVDEYLSILDKDLRKVFFDKKYPVLTKDQLFQQLKQYCSYPGRGIIASRFGQSFALIGVTQDTVLVLDSHFHSSGLTDIKGAYEHLTREADGGCNIIVWSPVLLL